MSDPNTVPLATPNPNPSATRQSVVYKCVHNSPVLASCAMGCAMTVGGGNRLVGIHFSRATISQPTTTSAGTMAPTAQAHVRVDAGLGADVTGADTSAGDDGSTTCCTWSVEA